MLLKELTSTVYFYYFGKYKQNILHDRRLFVVILSANLDWIIRFTLGVSLQWQEVKLFCNHPTGLENSFRRGVYQELSWINPHKSSDDVSELYAEIKIIRAGSSQFYLSKQDKGKEYTTCHGYFVVDPVLCISTGQMYLDSITIQTVLTKCLGPFSEWRNRLEVAHLSGFNMLHFSPIQELGESNSNYSIKNHLLFNALFSDEKVILDESKLKTFIDDLHKNWNMLSIVDVVWNHTANNSEWIRVHPEASYNLINSPHLRPAFLVDRALWFLNKEIMNGDWVDKGIPVLLSKESDLLCFSNVLR